MPLELLHRIAGRPLPLTVTDPTEIDQLRVLRAAGYVAVFLPALRAPSGFARVLTITAEGRKALLNEVPLTNAPR
jgi:hypothetical protein